MSKQNISVREEERKRKDKGSPDTGQGAAGDLGSDGDLGKADDGKSEKHTQSAPSIVKRKPKTVSKP